MKVRVLSAERINTGDGDSMRLVIQISDIADWDSAEIAKKMARLIELLDGGILFTPE
jgi:predicted component of type VI protein secretion system